MRRVRVAPRPYARLVVRAGAVRGVRGAGARHARGRAVHARGPAPRGALRHPDLLRGPLGVQPAAVPAPGAARVVLMPLYGYERSSSKITF